MGWKGERREKRSVWGLRETVHHGVHGFGWMSGCGVVCLGVGVPWQRGVGHLVVLGSTRAASG